MISVICGTNRPDSNTEKVAHNYCKYLTEKGVEFLILKLEDLPNDFGFNAMYGKHQDEVDRVISKHIIDCDKFVFIIPEYNGSYPGVLKTFLDCISPKDLHDKKAALVGLSNGAAGNLLGLDHLTAVLNYLRVDVLSRKPKLSRVGELIGDNDAFTDERSPKILREQIDFFLKF